MDIFNKQFSAADVAEAAEISPNSLQNWLKRGVIVGHRNIEGGGSPGRHRRFSWFNVMEIAIAGQLIETGLQPSDAFQAGAMFAHTAPGKSGWVGGRADKTPLRLPGAPFHYSHGDTMLAVRGDRTLVAAVSDFRDHMHMLAKMGRPKGLVIINVTQIFVQVVQNLGLGKPNEILDEMYPVDAAAKQGNCID